jgi:site-specific recombinase XerD
MVQEAVTLSQAIEGYFIAAQARRLSPHTLADYENTYRRLEHWLGDDPPVATVTASQVRDFLHSLNGLSAKTLLNYHVGLSALWTWSHKEGIVDKNIVRALDRPKPDKREIIPYTERDVKAILACCDRTRPYQRLGKRRSTHRRLTALRDRAIIILLLDTGIRASELCHLRLAQVDLTNHRITVLGKGRKERVLPISPRTAQVLWRYLSTREHTCSRDHLFTTRRGGPLHRNPLRQLLRRLGDRAGVPGTNIHRFRHTFAVTFLRNGGQMLPLQRILGHSSLDMVKRYVALAQTDIEQAHRDASPVSNWLL